VCHFRVRRRRDKGRADRERENQEGAKDVPHHNTASEEVGDAGEPSGMKLTHSQRAERLRLAFRRKQLVGLAATSVTLEREPHLSGDATQVGLPQLTPSG
jgi:hypothetical protein